MRGPFKEQHGKRVQTLLKSASQHVYQVHLSLWRQLSYKKSLLLITPILGLFYNILAANDKSPVVNRDNLIISIEIQLSQKQKLCLDFFLIFWNLASILNILKKKMTLIDFVFSKLRTPKMWLDKCLKSLFSEDPLRSKLVNGPEHCWNLH